MGIATEPFDIISSAPEQFPGRFADSGLPVWIEETIMRAITREHAIGQVLADVYTEAARAIAAASRGALEADRVALVIPPGHTGGDLAYRCFELARPWKAKPDAIAEELANTLEPGGLLARFEASGPYLNLHLDREALLARIFASVSEGGETYGHTDLWREEVVMMEYISPNTNKPLHLGHIRNGVLGKAVASLIAAQGATVKKSDIVNDRGIHITKSMLAYQHWGDGATPESLGIKGDHYVGQLYVRFDKALKAEQEEWLAAREIDRSALKEKEKKKIDAEFLAESKWMAEAAELLRRWEEGDEEVRELWRTMNGWVFAGFEETYKRLGIDFDRHYYESDIYQGGREVILDALEKGIFEKAENGAVIAPLSKHFKKMQDKAVLRADGTSLYITQDINLATIKFEDFGLTRSIYCIGSEQDYYMKQLIATLRLLGFPWAEGMFHLSYGMVYLPEGKMKSREGNVVDADNLMEDMARLAAEAIRERYPDLADEQVSARAEAIAISALTFHFLIVGRETPIHFDPKASLAFEGKTGPYLQYAHARVASLRRKAGDDWNPDVTPALEEDIEWQIAKSLMFFPTVVNDAAESYDPSRLAAFLIDLAQLYNTFWHDHLVLSAAEPVRSSRLLLSRSFQQVLHNGCRLLGFEALEEM